MYKICNGENFKRKVFTHFDIILDLKVPRQIFYYLFTPVVYGYDRYLQEYALVNTTVRILRAPKTLLIKSECNALTFVIGSH